MRQVKEIIRYWKTFIPEVIHCKGTVKFNFVLFLSLIGNLGFAANWYVSPGGIDITTNNNGQNPSNPLQTISFAVNNAWMPGDTIFVMEGVYKNPGYGSGNLNNGPVVRLNVTGQSAGWLIIRNFPGQRPKIKFDGAGGFVSGNQTYLQISGFEIEGPNQSITIDEALADRLNHSNYFSGRGIAIWKGHHINVHDNIIHDCPNSGIRINNGDYCNIHHNTVYNNTWWSSSAESAIVYATSLNVDTSSAIKMRITHNLVYNNINHITFYSGATGTGYGSASQDYIIDGSGCYITRNKDTYLYGWFYIANNISYGNGINGVVVHKSDRAIVTNNTCYLNGAVPLSEGRQSSSGITINSSSHVKVFNNISWPGYDTDYGYKIYNAASSNFIEASNNILAKGLSDFTDSQYVFTDPFFIDASDFDFHLLETSPAIDAGLIFTDLPEDDFEGVTRLDNPPDIGAYEYSGNTPSNLLKVQNEINKVRVYPNPTTGTFSVKCSETRKNLKAGLYSVDGRLIENKTVSNSGIIRFDIEQAGGIYVLKIQNDEGEDCILKVIKE